MTFVIGRLHIAENADKPIDPDVPRWRPS